MKTTLNLLFIFGYISLYAQLLAPSKIIVVPGNTCASISFDVPFNQYTNTNITYEIQINNQSNFIAFTESPCAVFNLINGRSYVFRIRAKQGSTFSAWSLYTKAIVPSSFAPDATYAYQNLKQIAIEMSQVRQNLARNAGFTIEANQLATEIVSLQNTIPAVPAVPYYGVGFFPKAIVSDNSNPYLVSLHSWARNYLAQPFVNYTKASTTNVVFTNFNSTRAISNDMFRLYWLLTSPESDYRYHPELFRRFLNFIYATSDDYQINGGTGLTIPGFTPNAIDDWFAQYGIAYGWRMALFSFKDIIPQSLQNKIRNSANIMANAVLPLAQSILTDGAYVNRDVSYAETLLNCGLLAKNATWYNFSNQIVTITNTSEVYPDGAFSYIWSQNEVANYHGGNNQSLARLYNMSENPIAKSILDRVANYELISIEPGFVPEFNTAPAWKIQWNTGSGYSGDFLGYLSANPYYKTLIDQRVSTNGYAPDLNNYVFFNKELQSKPLLNNYLIYDRNIQGLRARYNNFTYTITMRNISTPNSVGHQTLAGSMTTERGSGQLRDIHSGLKAAYAKVHTESGTTTEWDQWAYLINDINPRTALTRTIGSASTQGQLFRALSGPSAQKRNWQTFQEWLTLPDRMIGLIEVFPENNTSQQAFEVDIRYRFGHGINAVGGLSNPQTMVTNVVNQEYTYGDYKIKVLAHNCEQIFVAPSGINRDVGPGTELVFRNGSFNNGVRTTYPGTYRRFAMVEIANGTVPSTTTSRFSENGVIGIIASGSNFRYAVYRNTTNASRTVNISAAMITGITTRVHFPRTDTPGANSVVQTSTSITIPANEHRLIITSNNVQDQAASWTNFDVLQESLPAISISGNDLDYILAPGQTIQFNAMINNLGANTQYQWLVNGVNVGNNSTFFSSNTLTNNSEVQCRLTTTLANGSVYSVLSNSLIIRINSNPPVEINFEDNVPNQVSIGTNTPHKSSVFHIESYTRGVLLPRLSGSEIENMNNPAEGLLVYAKSIGTNVIDSIGYWFYSNNTWVFTNMDIDLYAVDRGINNNRLVILNDKELLFNSDNNKLTVDAGLQTTGAQFINSFRLINSSNVNITWLDTDLGVILPNGYTGSIQFPNATTNVNRVIAIKNWSGIPIAIQNTSGNPTGIYANEGTTSVSNFTVRWFISDGVSWRVFK